jgi:hypothetical protein
VYLTGGTMEGCTIDQPTLSPGESFIITSDLADISDCEFTAGGLGGHAVEIDTAGTYTFDANDFIGYGPSEFEFNSTDDVDAGTDVVTSPATHGYANGDEVFYSNEPGGSADIGLTHQTRYFVRAVTTTTLGFYVTKQDATADANRIALTSTGNETQSIYSANASVFNNSYGAVTINVTNGFDPTIRNGHLATTVVNNNITATVTVKDEAGAIIQNARVSVRTDPANVELLGGLTNASGIVTGTVPANSGAVSVRVRKGSGSGVDYVPVNSPQSIGATDFSVNITMLEDPINAT